MEGCLKHSPEPEGDISDRNLPPISHKLIVVPQIGSSEVEQDVGAEDDDDDNIEDAYPALDVCGVNVECNQIRGSKNNVDHREEHQGVPGAPDGLCKIPHVPKNVL